ncbi:13912_t:CDS:2, partial [Entrophospora sp. SA101]
DFNNNNSNETLPPPSSSPDNGKFTISTETSPVSFSSILKEHSRLSTNTITPSSPSYMLRQWDRAPGKLTDSNISRILNPSMMQQIVS